ncbi:MAG: L-threonylcarbamoyladenylate synthase [Deltaproteobacteria bacterium]
MATWTGSPEEERLFARAADLVRCGGVVLVATETFYALAADPFQDESLRRILAIKVRNEGKPLPLIAFNRAALNKIIAQPEAKVRRLMDRFWPGSLTLVLETTRAVPDALIGPTGKIGVRIPPPCPARTLAGRAGGLITATSANLSGGPNPDRVDEIARQVIDAVDLIVDFGPSPGGQPSTVAEPLGSTVRIIRDGAIPGAMIKEFFEREEESRSPKD